MCGCVYLWPVLVDVFTLQQNLLHDAVKATLRKHEVVAQRNKQLYKEHCKCNRLSCSILPGVFVWIKCQSKWLKMS